MCRLEAANTHHTLQDQGVPIAIFQALPAFQSLPTKICINAPEGNNEMIFS
jgi:hypothetical protein